MSFTHVTVMQIHTALMLCTDHRNLQQMRLWQRHKPPQSKGLNLRAAHAGSSMVASCKYTLQLNNGFVTSNSSVGSMFQCLTFVLKPRALFPLFVDTKLA